MNWLKIIIYNLGFGKTPKIPKVRIILYLLQLKVSNYIYIIYIYTNLLRKYSNYLEIEFEARISKLKWFEIITILNFGKKIKKSQCQENIDLLESTVAVPMSSLSVKLSNLYQFIKKLKNEWQIYF